MEARNLIVGDVSKNVARFVRMFCMLLSIIVPVYNVKNYLIKCLNSINIQTIEDYEVVIVDDGSTDGCGQIVDDYCKDKPKFHVYHKENGGLMSAWMMGVSVASGEYLGFVDSDDYIEKDMFEYLCTAALKSNADIVMCDRYDVIGENIQPPDYNADSLKEGLYQGKEMDRIKSMVFPLRGTPELTKARWNKLFKRGLFISNLKYCKCLSKTFEDRYITPPCIFSAESFYYIKKPLYYYVHRNGSNSGMYKPDLLDQIKRMYFVEKQVLIDKDLMEQFGENWEFIFMDYIRQYVSRNIRNVKGFRIRMKSAKQLLQDDLVNKRMLKYGKQDTSKMGRVLYMAYKMRMPVILAVASFLGDGTL